MRLKKSFKNLKHQLLDQKPKILGPTFKMATNSHFMHCLYQVKREMGDNYLGSKMMAEKIFLLSATELETYTDLQAKKWK